MSSTEKYLAALNTPYYLVHVTRLDGNGWEYSTTCDHAEDIPALLHTILESWPEGVDISLTLTYCEPLIYSVPTKALHKYGSAGEREAVRRASA